ncbi:MAG: hypothetical protein LBL72_09560 [Candidatus Accumulibacter sp.]|jgi:hypothetical protein|nr:hypothetical protein [Accumulibacter sp.]
MTKIRVGRMLRGSWHQPAGTSKNHRDLIVCGYNSLIYMNLYVLIFSKPRFLEAPPLNPEVGSQTVNRIRRSGGPERGFESFKDLLPQGKKGVVIFGKRLPSACDGVR